jgi:hypothetical protein
LFFSLVAGVFLVFTVAIAVFASFVMPLFALFFARDRVDGQGPDRDFAEKWPN